MKKTLLILTFLTSLQFGFAQLSTVSRNVLLEMVGSASLGFTSAIDTSIANQMAIYPNLNVAVFHPSQIFVDAMGISETDDYINEFYVSFPSGTIDRKNFTGGGVAISQNSIAAPLAGRNTVASNASIQLFGSLNSNEDTANIRVVSKFHSGSSSFPIGVSVLLVEDSIIGFGNGYDQLNFQNHPTYGNTSPIVGYVHRKVVRSVFPTTSPWGDTTIVPQNFTIDSSYTYQLSIPIDSSYDTSQISFIALLSYFGVNANDKEVLNSTEVALNSLVVGASDNPYSLKELSVFPNPANEQATLKLNFNSRQTANVNLYSQEGKLVSSDQNLLLFPGENFVIIDTHSLNEGIYFVMLNLGEKSIQRKLVIMH